MSIQGMTAAFILTSMVTFAGLEQPPNETIVDLQVTVLTGEGRPFANALIAGHTSAGFWRKGTDASGKATIRLRVNDVNEKIYVRSAKGPGTLAIEPTPSQPELRSAREAFDQVYKAWAWPVFAEAIVTPGSGGINTAVATLQAVPSVAMRGRLLKANGEPLESAKGAPPLANVWGCGMNFSAVCDRAGEFEVPNVPHGVAGEAECFIDGGLLQWIVWSDVKAVDDFDLGDIRTIMGAPTGIARGHIENFIGGDMRFDRGVQPGACLISADATQGARVSRLDDSNRHADESPEAFAKVKLPRYAARPVKVPPGVYFVAPGDSGSQCQRIIRDAIRKGEDVEKKWGLPRILVEEGKETTFTIDDEKVYKAVMGELPPTIDGHKSAIVTDDKKDDAKDVPKTPAK